MYSFDRNEYEKRMAWYTDARFGMFIHWGLYSIPARGEWIRSEEEITKEDYMRYFEEFDPVDYDPKKWARAAKEAGMKYVVLTAKHHDGFCLFDSKYTDFKVTNTKLGRDVVKDFVEAVRGEGLKVGLYFTLLDWYHDDYPHYGDKQHPMRNRPEYGNEGRNFDRYLDYMHNQIREICTNYGRLDVLWFDFSYEDKYNVMRGEAWRATELINMVRELQPQVIIDNRLEVSGEGYGSLWTGDPKPYHGDFVSPEQMVPPQGIQDKNGRDMVWESCVTMNRNWGYCEKDHYFKPASMLIRKLVECVSKGGNMLLNVGPDARGNIPPQSMAILEEIGAWMKKTGTASTAAERPESRSRSTAALQGTGTACTTTCLRTPSGPCRLRESGRRRWTVSAAWRRARRFPSRPVGCTAIIPILCLPTWGRIRFSLIRWIRCWRSG